MNILFLSDPFKILYTIIGLVTVLVICNKSVGALRNERLKNHLVDKNALAFSVFSESDSLVSSARRFGIKALAFVKFYRHDMTEIAYFIKTFITKNRTPLLTHLKRSLKCKRRAVYPLLSRTDSTRRKCQKIMALKTDKSVRDILIITRFVRLSSLQES